MTPQPGWTEAEFQRFVVEYARERGWVVRVMDQRNARGVLRAQSKDQRGWPDLKCVRGRDALWIELKAAGKHETPMQSERISQLRAADETVLVADPTTWDALSVWLA